MDGAIGVLIPNIPLQRLPGDVGHPSSFNYPVLIHPVEAVVNPYQMVTEQLNRTVLEAYLHGAAKLQTAGATVITTSCGFLAVLQQDIAQELHVPFIASSLLQVPLVYGLVQKPIGIITANDAVLTDVHLNAAGVADIPLVIRGLQTCDAFAAAFLRCDAPIDSEAIGRAIEATALETIKEYPDIGAFIFECHNLGTWRQRVQQATQRPVFDVISLVTMVASSSIIGY